MTQVHNPQWRLRDGFAAPQLLYAEETHLPRGGINAIPREPKLGLKPGSFHKPKLKLADYIAAETQPPAAVSRPHPGFSWGMLANDRLGDCVCAMILHSIEDFHLDVGSPAPGFIDADAIALYQKIGGYDPNDPSTDQGCDESVAMQTWQAGLPQTSDGVVHQIVDTVGVDPGNLAECRIAIDEFIALQIGIDLPASAQGQSEWEVVGDPQQDPSSQPGSWGGHGIPFREYDADTFKCVTWGGELLLTVAFHQAYVSECHVVVTQEMLDAKGNSPTGVQWCDLESDLRKLAPAQEKASGDAKRPKGKKGDDKSAVEEPGDTTAAPEATEPDPEPAQDHPKGKREQPKDKGSKKK